MSSRTPASIRSAAIAMSSGVQSRSTRPNLLPEKRPERVLAAHAAAHAPGDRADHLVGDVETVGLVDAGEVVDGDQHEAARRAEPDRFVDGVFENLGQMMPVQFAGEAVVAGQIGEPAHMLVALVDDADEAVGAHRLAVGPGEPAADILDPEPGVRRRVGTDAILNLIGDAAAVVALVRLHDDVEARLGVLGLEHLRIGAAGRDRGESGISSTAAALAPQCSASVSMRQS